MRNAVLLLTITAALNVAMWLWVVSMALTCMYGVIQSQDQYCTAKEETTYRHRQMCRPVGNWLLSILAN